MDADTLITAAFFRSRCDSLKNFKNNKSPRRSALFFFKNSDVSQSSPGHSPLGLIQRSRASVGGYAVRHTRFHAFT